MPPDDRGGTRQTVPPAHCDTDPHAMFINLHRLFRRQYQALPGRDSRCLTKWTRPRVLDGVRCRPSHPAPVQPQQPHPHHQREHRHRNKTGCIRIRRVPAPREQQRPDHAARGVNICDAATASAGAPGRRLRERPRKTPAFQPMTKDRRQRRHGEHGAVRPVGDGRGQASAIEGPEPMPSMPSTRNTGASSSQPKNSDVGPWPPDAASRARRLDVAENPGRCPRSSRCKLNSASATS